MNNRLDNNDDFNKKNAAKSCGICRNVLGSSTDIAYCNDCTTSNRQANKKLWQKHFAVQAANTLSDKNIKLASANTLDLNQKVSGIKAKIQYMKTVQASKEVDLSVVKTQVAGYIPNILAELGLTRKVDASLLLDAIVPSQISQPIADITAAKFILKDIIRDASFELMKDTMLPAFNTFQMHGKQKEVVASTLNEGIIRVSTHGDIARNVLAEKQEDKKEKDDTTFGIENADEEKQEDKKEIEATKKDDDKKNEDGTVEHLNDEQFQDILDEKMNTTANLFDGTIKSFQVKEDFTIRKLKEASSPKKSDMSLFAYANRNIKLPVEAVRLNVSDKAVITKYQPLHNFDATYKDGKKLSWASYKTDVGYLMISANSSFHAKSLEDFRNFVASDSTFSQWAHLPVEASTTIILQLDDEDDNELDEIAEHILPFLMDFMEEYNDDGADNIALETANYVKHTTASEVGKSVLHHIGKTIGQHLDASPLHPKLKAAVKPYLGMAHKSEHGNALFNDVSKALKPISVEIPEEKQQRIAQIIEQLKVASDEDTQINLLASFYEATPHLDEEQKKEWLPKVYHSFHDSLKDTDNKDGQERKKDEEEMLARWHMTPTMEVMEITSGLNKEQFEQSLEVLAEMGYDEETILTAAEIMFVRVADGDSVCYSNEAYSGMQDAKEEPKEKEEDGKE